MQVVRGSREVNFQAGQFVLATLEVVTTKTQRKAHRHAQDITDMIFESQGNTVH